MKDILIVEDGVKERERLHSLFVQAGYKVVVCETVTDAEEKLKDNGFRLAILDIGLSDKSGSYLFNTIKKIGRVNYIIIFTGNPSVHLKQRFLEEGATDYIVKASAEAQNDKFLSRVIDIIGKAEKQSNDGIELIEFLDKYVNQSSKSLFFDAKDSLPSCKKCGSLKYQVIFTSQTQIPPDIMGKVVCASCGTEMDPDIG